MRLAPSNLSRILRLFKYLVLGKGKVFIGDIPIIGEPISIKDNMYGGKNIMYKAYPGQYCKAITKDMQISEQEITAFSIHQKIPLYRVTFEISKPVLVSPLNSILVYNEDSWDKVDLTEKDYVGSLTPAYIKSGRKRFGVFLDRISSVEYLGEDVTMYDISMNEHHTFLTGEGVFLFDSVAIHVPITNKGIEDSLKMLPSKNIVWEPTGKTLTRPEHASAAGLHMLSKTKEGRSAINEILPEQYRINKEINKRDLDEIIQRMDRDKIDNIGQIISKLRRTGDDQSYRSGLTMALADLTPLKRERDELLDKIKGEISKIPRGQRNAETIGNVMTKYIGERGGIMEKSLPSDNPLSIMLKSQSRGSPSQFGDALISPIAVKGMTHIEEPISHSYIEGLDPWEYYLSAAGARHGVIGRSTGTSKPGALSSELLASANQVLIGDTKTDKMKVINLTLDDPLELEDRIVGEDIKDKDGEVIVSEGTVVTPQVIQIAKKNRLSSLPVYTPLGSTSTDGTIPSMAYGVGRRGKLHEPGTNIGALSAHAVVDPLYGSAMQAFHTGASLEDKAFGYPRIKQLLELTKDLPHTATLAEVSGKIDKVEKDDVGGHNIFVDGVKHYVKPGNTPRVAVNHIVDKGDFLSDGPAQPSKIADLKGLDAARTYLVEELKKNVPSMKRRNAEVLVETITRWGEVLDPGDSEYLPGDIELISKLESTNEDLGDKIEFKPVFKGINQLPQITQGWASQLGFRELKRTLKRNIEQGAEEEKHSLSPTVATLFPSEFGLGEKGKY